jgi:hypothetical protein
MSLSCGVCGLPGGPWQIQYPLHELFDTGMHSWSLKGPKRFDFLMNLTGRALKNWRIVSSGRMDKRLLSQY